MGITLPADPQKPPVQLPKKNITVVVLLVLMLTLVAVFVGVIIKSMPYFRPEDPSQLLHDSHVAQQEALMNEEPEEIEPEADLPAPERNPYGRLDFQYNRENYLLCTAQRSYPGIDVSAFQGDIDWQKVADSGIRFAMIRLGYRGWGQAGNMKVDENVEKNLKGAREAGLEVGAYFFSQATSIAEVDEEIEFLLEILGDYRLTMPLVLDWEYVSEEARTAKTDARTLTDCLRHFGEVMTAKGYHPMIYFNWNQAKNLLYLHELEDYPFWLAYYSDRMSFPYRVEMWQYTCTGKVPGITGDVDINVYIPDLRMAPSVEDMELEFSGEIIE